MEENFSHPVPGQNIPQEPQTVVQEKKDKSPRVLPYVLVAVILLAFSASGFWLYQKKTWKKPAPKAIPTTTPMAATPTVSPEPPIPADWKTFTSQQWSISLKYPPNWFADTDFEQNEKLIVNQLLTLILLENMSAEPHTAKAPWIQVTVFRNPDRLPLEKYGKSPIWTIDPFLYYPSAKTIDVAGEVGYKSVSVYCEPAECDKVVIPLGDNIYLISLVFDIENTDKEKGAFRNQFDQILSTFKFLDETDKMTDWKTFSSHKNYQIRYPNTLVYEERVTMRPAEPKLSTKSSLHSNY